MTSFDPSFDPSADEFPDTGLRGLAERGWCPDALFRHAIRRLCARRLHADAFAGPAASAVLQQLHVDGLRQRAFAVAPSSLASPRHALPPSFFRHCLGPQVMGSACYYPSGRETLAQAEDAMLELHGARAELEDHQSILDLGCGWGSLTLWMARRYPGASITAVSDSLAQCDHVRACCAQEGLGNVRVVHGDIGHFEQAASAYDRVVSIELLERSSNYRVLLARIALWLRPGGKLFLQFLAHRGVLRGPAASADEEWMAGHGGFRGLIPSVDTLLWFQDDLKVERCWLVDGTHYRRTANHWLANLDAAREEVMALLRTVHGEDARFRYRRWRMAWMALAERCGYADGTEWLLAHYRFVRPISWEDSLVARF